MDEAKEQETVVVTVAATVVATFGGRAGRGRALDGGDGGVGSEGGIMAARVSRAARVKRGGGGGASAHEAWATECFAQNLRAEELKVME